LDWNSGPDREGCIVGLIGVLTIWVLIGIIAWAVFSIL
jgi:hypothetical protein